MIFFSLLICKLTKGVERGKGLSILGYFENIHHEKVTVYWKNKPAIFRLYSRDWKFKYLNLNFLLGWSHLWIISGFADLLVDWPHWHGTAPACTGQDLSSWLKAPDWPLVPMTRFSSELSRIDIEESYCGGSGKSPSDWVSRGF